MNLFVWEDCHKLTDNYHSGGGLLIVARDLERAKEIFTAQYKAEDRYDRIVFPADPPSFTWTVPDDSAEVLLVFPDAGCC